MRAAFLLAAASVLACGCSTSKGTQEFVSDAAINLVTSQQGTMTEARGRRGTGPFKDYAVPPAEMISIVERVLQSKVVAVFVNRRASEVYAKERSGKEAEEDWYAPKWESAVVVIVHPVAEDEGRSRVEVHGISKGLFRRGSIDWEREVPPMLDAAVARRGQPPVVPLR